MNEAQTRAELIDPKLNAARSVGTFDKR